MNVRCPACSKTLNVPDAAAGKVIRCPCGKTIQTPAAAKPTGGPQQPRPPQRPVAPQRTPSSTAAPTKPVNPYASDFDDLTETDLKPIRGVAKPGATVERSRVAEDQMLLKMAGKDEKFAKSVDGSHPAMLKFMGGWNFAGAVQTMLALIAILGLSAFFPVPRELEAAKGFFMIMVMAFFTFDIAFQALSGAACFFDWRSSWFFLLFAYSFAVITRAVDLYDIYRWEAPIGLIIFRVIGLLATAVFLAYLFGPEVRGYYKTKKEPPKWPAVASVGGGLVGLILSSLYVWSSL